MRFVLLAAALGGAGLWLLPGALPASRAGGEPGKAAALNRRLLIVDTHIDTPTHALENPEWRFGERHTNNHVDLPRLIEAGLDAPFMVVYTPSELAPEAAMLHALRLCDLIHGWAATHADRLTIARSPDEVRAAKREGKIGAVLCMENAAPILPGRLDVLRTFYRLGVRYVGLAHWRTNHLCDSATDDARHDGVSAFGRQVIVEANRLGMMLDVSHVSDDAVRDYLRYSKAPIIASHSNARALCPHVRNLPDDLLEEIAARGGVVQLNFAAQYVSADFLARFEKRQQEAKAAVDELEATFADDAARLRREKRKLREALPPLAPPPLADWLRHLDHIVRLIGVDHVGIGSDFDGVGTALKEVSSVTDLEFLTAALLDRGWNEEGLAKLYGENLLRVWGEVEEAARRR